MASKGFQMDDEADFLEEIERFEGAVFYKDYEYGISGGNKRARFLFYPWLEDPYTEEDIERQQELLKEFDTAEEILEKATFPDGKTMKEVLHLVYFAFR